MKTIKFRAWSKKDKKMYDDADVLLDKSFHFAYEGTDLETEGPLEPIVQVNTTINMAIEQGFVLMQFTGLKCPVNKDGFNEQGGYKTWQEIWEGDIVQFHSSTDFTIGQENRDKKFVVVYQAELGGGFCLKHISVYDKQGGCNEVIEGWHAIDPYQFSNLIHHFNVVGNIYENPDLLKGENL